MFERQREMILIHDLFILADTETRGEEEKKFPERMKKKVKERN